MIINRILIALALSAVSLTTVRAFDRVSGRSVASRSEVIARHAMAATSHPLATQIALDILKAGGNAIDAAIAANAALGVMEPTGCGIGGDLFAIVWDSQSQRLHGLNASGRSPNGLTLAEFRRRNLAQIPKYGPLPVSVPGCVDGWFELHKKFGQLPMSQVLAPAIAYAEEGFPMTEFIAFRWAQGAKELADYPGFRETFMPQSAVPAKASVVRRPRLANTLKRIAQGGRDIFYRGEIARQISDFMASEGGFLRLEDLQQHSSEWVEPVSIDYRGYRLWELPPNGQGIAALQILNVLKGFDISEMGFGSANHIHYFVEAKKLAFEDRAKFYADPAFQQIPVRQLISNAYADQQRERISPELAATAYAAGNPALEHGDTIYLTVADEHRNMVSLIQSNFRGFGSGMCPPGLGFCLQNRGELFDLTPDRYNTYAPGKRPFHTIIPAFITKAGRPYVSFGVMGGATQPQGHAQIMMNLVDFGMNLQEAGDAPRIVHTGSSQPTGENMTDGGTVHLETGFAYDSVRQLLTRGHTVSYALGVYGGYQAIQYDAENDVYLGASESRKDGNAAGY